MLHHRGHHQLTLSGDAGPVLVERGEAGPEPVRLRQAELGVERYGLPEVPAGQHRPVEGAVRGARAGLGACLLVAAAMACAAR